MAARVTLTNEHGVVLNDREQWLADQDAQEEERAVMAQVVHFRAQGVGLAGFAAAFYDALLMDESHRFSREEVLALLGQALRGR